MSFPTVSNRGERPLSGDLEGFLNCLEAIKNKSSKLSVADTALLVRVIQAGRKDHRPLREYAGVW